MKNPKKKPARWEFLNELDGRPAGGKAPELLRAIQDAAVRDFQEATARTIPIAK